MVLELTQVHVGFEPNVESGAVIPPIFLSTTYKQEAVGAYKVSCRFFPFTYDFAS
jgi:cystathionine beta-lyase/cystathionine gamma-synthase